MPPQITPEIRSGLQRLIQSLSGFISNYKQTLGGGQSGSIQSPNYNPLSGATSPAGASFPSSQGTTTKPFDTEAFDSLYKSLTKMKGVPSTPSPYDEEGQKRVSEFQTSRAEELRKMFEPQKQILEGQKQEALAQHAEESQKRTLILKRNLAMRGTFGTSSQGDQLIADQEVKEKRLSSEIESRYAIAMSDIDVGVKDRILADVDKRISDMTAQRNSEIEQINQEFQTAMNIYKDFKDLELKDEANEMQKVRLELDQALAANSITAQEHKEKMDILNFREDVLNNESARRKNEAETEKTKSETQTILYNQLKSQGFTDEQISTILGE